MLSALNNLVESRIAKAQAAGDFADLPGAGQPLDLREDGLVPQEVRVANRVLKNAGLVPEDMVALTTLAQLRASLQEPDLDEASRSHTRHRIAGLIIGLQSRGVGLAALVMAVAPEPTPIAEQ